MVKHDALLKQMDKIAGKIILDCYNVCPFEGTYRI
jgi:UDP-N-acetyl-D-mannosaminuronic acid dehydrogenase